MWKASFTNKHRQHITNHTMFALTSNHAQLQPFKILVFTFCAQESGIPLFKAKWMCFPSKPNMLSCIAGNTNHTRERHSGNSWWAARANLVLVWALGDICISSSTLVFAHQHQVIDLDVHHENSRWIKTVHSPSRKKFSIGNHKLKLGEMDSK